MTTLGRLRDVRLRNFKSFKDLQLRMGKMTVLTGTNSSGKSSVLQAIALMEQSKDQDPPGFVLNGDLVELGDFEDVLFDRIDEEGQDDQVVSIGVRGTSGSWRTFAGTAASRADFVSLAAAPEPLGGSLPWRHLAYVRADRLGPTLFHRKSYTAVVRDRAVGARGEYAVHLLMEHASSEVRAAMCLKGVASTLEQQCGAWIDRLSVATRIYPSNLEGTGTALLTFSDGPVTGLSSGRQHRSTNVGFGLSYSLPVIVACLSAKSGDLILIENPEAHLHPRGQAVLAELAALAAKAGAQVVLETHSDHVLNRVRLAVADRTLRANDVAVVYFSRNEATGGLHVQRLQLDGRGQLGEWPSGFFDEYVDALLALSNYDE